MGTTVTGALFDGEQLSLAHIGDSRAYLLRDGRLERLTHDHSWVQSLVDDGKISAAEAAVPSPPVAAPQGSQRPAGQRPRPDLRAGAGRRPGSVLQRRHLRAGRRPRDRDGAAGPPTWSRRSNSSSERRWPRAASTTSPPSSPTSSRPTGGGVTARARRRRRADDPRGRRQSPVGRGRRRGHPDQGSPRRPAATASPGTAHEAEDEARYNPQPPRKRRVPRVLVGLLALVLIVGAGLGAGYAWTRNQFFVGAANDRVAIYQGLPGSLPGIQLSTVYEVQPLLLNTPAALLPEHDHRRDRGRQPRRGPPYGRGADRDRQALRPADPGTHARRPRRPTPTPTPDADAQRPDPRPTRARPGHRTHGDRPDRAQHLRLAQLIGPPRSSIARPGPSSSPSASPPAGVLT